jgi:galactose mutarotase-like enzyme
MERSVKIRNGFVHASIETLGAELTELARIGGQNVLWQKDDVHWNRVAPNLFPIVGRLKNDSYMIQGKQYSMTQHGFARDRLFMIEAQTDVSVTLLLTSDDTTCERYPFSFEFRVTFTLVDNGIQIEYSVKNSGQRDLPFSVGGHPGFALSDHLSNYELRFPEPLNIERHLLDGSYLSGRTETMHIDVALTLSNELFKRDAIVFIEPPFKELTLAHKEKGTLLKVSSDHWEALGIWTKTGAPFLCIEPWWGYADRTDASGDLYCKSGIHHLKPGNGEGLSFSIELSDNENFQLKS